MKRVAAVAAVAALGLLALPALAIAAAEDQADGSGKFSFLGPAQGIISAHGTPVAAKGNVQLKSSLGTFKGSVECLNVFPISGGLRAILEGPLDQPAPFGIPRYRAVVDDLGNGQGTGARDRISVNPAFQSAQCQPGPFDLTSPVDSGNFELKDRVP